MNFKSVLVGAIMIALLMVISCENFTPREKATANSREPKVVVRSETRYELHDIRNGTFYGTALLDKQSGRVWTLASDSKGGRVSDVVFQEVLVIPVPER